MKTAGFMGGLQLAGKGFRVRGVFYVQTYQSLNSLLPPRPQGVLTGAVDKASHDLGDGYSILLG